MRVRPRVPVGQIRCGPFGFLRAAGFVNPASRVYLVSQERASQQLAQA